MLLLSLIKCIEIIGEAASRISPSTRSELPRIQWQDITDMRNRLVHAYFDINPNIVWQTVTVEVPALMATFREGPRNVLC